MKKRIAKYVFNSSLLDEKKDAVTGAPLLFGYFGIFFVAIGIFLLMPLLMLIFYPEEENMYYAFLIPGLISLVLGGALTLLIFRKKQGKLTPLQDLLLLVGVWIIAIFTTSIPYLFYGYSFSQSMFEATSGYTSAGLTIVNWAEEIKYLEDGTSEVIDHMLFFHRSLSQLVGGIGLVLVVTSAVSESSGVNVYLLEGHNDKLLPNLAKSARLIFAIYLGYIVFGACLYMSVGVKPFDAFNHAMAALATGGFSTKANNINTLVAEVSLNGEWRGIMVEVITEVLMLLGGTNFVIHYSIFHGKFKILKHFEYVVLLLIFIVIWPINVIGMTQYYGGNIAAGFRYGTFEMISALSTAGFQSIDSYQAHYLTPGQGTYGFSPVPSSFTFNQTMECYKAGTLFFCPSYVLVILAICMSIGMQVGSTAGGIKTNRIGYFFLDIWYRLKGLVNIPEAKSVRTCYKYGQKVRVDKDEITEAQTFIGAFVTILLLGSTILSIVTSACNVTSQDGLGLPYTWTDCLFEFSSSLGTVGLSCGMTSYTTMPAILWIEMIGMLLGRLEIFVFFSLSGKFIKRIRENRYVYRERRKQKSV